MRLLHVVADLALPDAWVAAGAVRNAVWDALHGFRVSTPLNDVDVVWFDRARATRAEDKRLEAVLSARMSDVTWSVKNEARMHVRNGHAPYAGCLDAMGAWPETATAIAARLGSGGAIEVQAAYGFDDLLRLVVRRSPRCPEHVFRERLRTKAWLRLWPRLTVVEGVADRL
jgi:hypothetical protein